MEQRVVRWEPIGDFKEALERSLASADTYRETFRAPEARLLVVDDTVMNLTVIENLLKKTRILIDTAESGFEMLDMIQKEHYDLIFLDHRMPKMDGIETLQKMREMDASVNQNKDTPVIVLTANAVSGAREEYLRNGFDDYMTKPIQSAQLEQLIIRYLPEDKVILTDEADGEEDEGLPDIYWQIPELDVNKGLENCGDCESFLQAVRIYQESAQDNLEEIREAFDKKDYPAYTIKVHALKSSSRIIGASSIGNLAERMEQAGNAGDTESIEKNTLPLLRMYRGLAEKLKNPESVGAGTFEEAGQGLQSAGQPGGGEAGQSLQSAGQPEKEAAGQDPSLPEIEPEALAEAYAAMREIAGMFDYDSLIHILDELDNFRLPDEEAQRLQKLRRAAAKPDWDKVHMILT